MSRKQRTMLALMALATPLLLAGAILLAGRGDAANASSHREAPLISKDQNADTTDVYAWIPQGVTDRIVLAANWIPFEAPEGGPNYYEWDDNVLYEIHVDNDGDALADVTYRLESRVEVGNPDTFLYNTGTIDTIADPDWNRKQFYTVTEMVAGGATTVLVGNVLAPPVNIGSKSTPAYDVLAQEATYQVVDGADTIDIFAGQRDDPFWVDLQVFDLLTLRGQPAPIGYSMGNNEPIDSLSGFNVHSLVVELPIDRLTAGSEPVLGVWATSRRAPGTVFSALNNEPAADAAHVQVSRLGMPLTNEVVIPMGLKDTFNAISPDVDLTVYNLLQESVEDPELGNLLCALYGVPLPGDTGGDCDTDYVDGTPRSGRGDIFDIFLTGMVTVNPYTVTTAGGPVALPAGTNVNQPAGVTPAEMLRVNTALSGATCHPTPQRLGLLAGDACGFPNGRRPIDDVVEIELLAVAGAAYEVLDDRDASFSYNDAFSSVLSDGVDSNDMMFMSQFPYLAVPHSGQEHIHENPTPPPPTALSFGAVTLQAGGVPWLYLGLALLSAALLTSFEVGRRRRDSE